MYSSLKLKKVSLSLHALNINSIDIYENIVFSCGDDDKAILIDISIFEIVSNFYDIVNGIKYGKILNKELILYYGQKSNKLLLTKYDGNLQYMFEILYENVKLLEYNFNSLNLFTIQNDELYLFYINTDNKTINYCEKLKNPCYLARFNFSGDKLLLCSFYNDKYEISLYIKKDNINFIFHRKLEKKSSTKIVKVEFSSTDTKIILLTEKFEDEKIFSKIFVVSLINDEIIINICRFIDELILDFSIYNWNYLFSLTNKGNIYCYNIYTEKNERYLIKTDNELVTNGKILSTNNSNILIYKKNKELIIYCLSI